MTKNLNSEDEDFPEKIPHVFSFKSQHDMRSIRNDMITIGSQLAISPNKIETNEKFPTPKEIQKSFQNRVRGDMTGVTQITLPDIDSKTARDISEVDFSRQKNLIMGPVPTGSDLYNYKSKLSSNDAFHSTPTATTVPNSLDNTDKAEFIDILRDLGVLDPFFFLMVFSGILIFVIFMRFYHIHIHQERRVHEKEKQMQEYFKNSAVRFQEARTETSHENCTNSDCPGLPGKKDAHSLKDNFADSFSISCLLDDCEDLFRDSSGAPDWTTGKYLDKKDKKTSGNTLTKFLNNKITPSYDTFDSNLKAEAKSDSKNFGSLGSIRKRSGPNLNISPSPTSDPSPQFQTRKTVHAKVVGQPISDHVLAMNARKFSMQHTSPVKRLLKKSSKLSLRYSSNPNFVHDKMNFNYCPSTVTGTQTGLENSDFIVDSNDISFQVEEVTKNDMPRQVFKLDSPENELPERSFENDKDKSFQVEIVTESKLQKNKKP